MNLGISGRRAAVAAAGRGLGYATAAALAAEGVQVAICSRNQNAIVEAANRIGDRAVPLVADVSTVDGARAFVDAARDSLGGIDILVTNAGGPPPGDFSTTDVDQYLAAFELNCLSVIAMCNAAVPDMRRQGWGRVVAITSLAVRQPMPAARHGSRPAARGRGRARDPCRSVGPSRGLRHDRCVPLLGTRQLSHRLRDPRRRRRVRWLAVSTATASTEAADHGILTLPNLISVGRLACVPLFLWLLLAREARVAAAVLLAVLGATDWIDGWIARHFHQGSEVGKVLDPTADRVLLVFAGVALLVDGSLPLWVGVVVLAREVVISVAVLALAAVGARRMEVQWAGKAGTLALMFALPGFLLADATSGAPRVLLLAATWAFTIGGLALSYYAALTYIPQARAALRDGRAGRHERIAA